MQRKEILHLKIQHYTEKDWNEILKIKEQGKTTKDDKNNKQAVIENPEKVIDIFN